MGWKLAPTYLSWRDMHRRCYDKKNKSYHTYGRIGISVHKSWFVWRTFLNDMGIKPEGMSLDRINNLSNYGPENCRWATPKEQAQNSKKPKFVEFDGKTLCLTDWAIWAGLKPNTLTRRLLGGWDFQRALLTPSRKK